MIGSRLHVLGQKESNALGKLVISTANDFSQTSIPMTTGLSMEALAKVLELEGSSSKQQTNVGNSVTKLIEDM